MNTLCVYLLWFVLIVIFFFTYEWKRINSKFTRLNSSSVDTGLDVWVVFVYLILMNYLSFVITILAFYLLLCGDFTVCVYFLASCFFFLFQFILHYATVGCSCIMNSTHFNFDICPRFRGCSNNVQKKKSMNFACWWTMTNPIKEYVRLGDKKKLMEKFTRQPKRLNYIRAGHSLFDFCFFFVSNGNWLFCLKKQSQWWLKGVNQKFFHYWSNKLNTCCTLSLKIKYSELKKASSR